VLVLKTSSATKKRKREERTRNIYKRKRGKKMIFLRCCIYKQHCGKRCLLPFGPSACLLPLSHSFALPTRRLTHTNPGTRSRRGRKRGKRILIAHSVCR
jgi:hypothetical protein